MWRLEHLHFHFYWFPKVTFFILFSKIHKSFRLTWMIRKEMKYFGKDGFTHEISTIVSEQFWFIVVQNESQNPFIAQDFFYYWMPKKVNFKIWLLQLATMMLTFYYYVTHFEFDEMQFGKLSLRNLSQFCFFFNLQPDWKSDSLALMPLWHFQITWCIADL